MRPAQTPSGDDQIDRVRAEVAAAPATEANYASRLSVLWVWMCLLQRQGYDLDELLPALDALDQAVAEGGGAAACRALDRGYAALEEIQGRPPPPPLAGADTPPRAPGADWPVYGGNLHHTASTDEPGPARGQVAWKYPAGLAWYPRPAVAAGRVYVASPGMRARAWCLELATGAEVWTSWREWSGWRLGARNPLPQSYATPAAASTPVLTQTHVVFNEMGAQSRDEGARSLLWLERSTGRLARRAPAGYCDYRVGYARLAGNGEYLVFPDAVQRLQAEPPQVVGHNQLVCVSAADGRERWRCRTGLSFAEPVVDGDRVYLGTLDGLVFCLHLPGAGPREYFGFSDRRRARWTFAAGGPANAPVAHDARRVYFGANDGCCYALDRDTGELVWRRPVSAREPRSFQLFSRPTLAGDRLYLGTTAGELLCLAAADGLVLWRAALSDWARAAPAAADGWVAAATLDGRLHVFRDRGDAAQAAWTARPGEHPILADLVAAEGRLLVTDATPRLRCLDLRTGATLWERPLLVHARIAGREVRADEPACGGFHQSKPTAAGGQVYVGTPSRFVCALKHDTGALVWRFEMGAAVSGSPVVAGDRVLAGQQGGEDWFYALDARDGRPLWRQALGWVWSSANVDGGRAFVPGVDGYLTCLDVADGAIRWRYRTGRAAHPEAPIEQGRVFFGSWDSFVYAFDCATGALLWKFHTGGSPDSGAPIACGGRLYLPLGGTRLCCLDAATGRLLWEHAGKGCMNASPALWNGRLYISESVRGGSIPPAARIRCLDAVSGHELWEHPGGGITGPAVAGGKVYFGSTAHNWFWCVDALGRGDGGTRCFWRAPLGDRVYESVPAIYAGRAFILSDDGYLYALE